MLKIQINVTVEQAQAIAKALDIYSRLTSGQVGMIAEMVADQSLPLFAENGKPAPALTVETCDEVRRKMKEVGKLLGYGDNGSHLGIGNHHLPMNGLRAYEVSRVLDKALAEHRQPNPPFRGVDYDGLLIRYTQDEIPEAIVCGEKEKYHD